MSSRGQAEAHFLRPWARSELAHAVLSRPARPRLQALHGAELPGAAALSQPGVRGLPGRGELGPGVQEDAIGRGAASVTSLEPRGVLLRSAGSLLPTRGLGPCARPGPCRLYGARDIRNRGRGVKLSRFLSAGFARRPSLAR